MSKLSVLRVIIIYTEIVICVHAINDKGERKCFKIDTGL